MIRILILIGILLLSVEAKADWQADLKAVFDNVDTFDNIADWTPARLTIQSTIQSYPSDFSAFSNRTDGGMVWQLYQVYATPDQAAIKDHGTAYRFAEGAASNATNHKSLAIDFNMDDPDNTLGAQRMAWQVGYGTGQSPSTGYDEMYFFHMVKYPWGFFNIYGANVVPYMEFIKLTCIAAGFNLINEWGTATEHSNQTAAGAATQALHEYGSSGWYFFEPYAAGTYLGGVHIAGAFNTSSQVGYIFQPNQVQYDNPGWGAPIYNDEWMAVEQRIKLSTPDGADDGEAEVWIYDQTGAELYHVSVTNLRMVRDGTTLDFTHKLNKIELGGNRLDGSGYATVSASGTHTGADSTTALTTVITAPSFGSVWPGVIVHNTTDGSSCRVTTVAAHTLTCASPLSGGSDNTWSAGDSFTLSHPKEYEGTVTSAPSPTMGFVDSNAYPTNGGFPTAPAGTYLWNTTTLAVCRIASNDLTSVTCAEPLKKGSRNTFEVGDTYAITYSFGPLEHYYVDDVIVHGSQIAPTYFDLLGDNIACYPDADNDLYPGSGSEVVETTCSANYYIASHFTAMTTDCNDANANINPGKTDVCGNSVDEDCSGGDATCPQPSASLKKWGGKHILSVTTQGD